MKIMRRLMIASIPVILASISLGTAGAAPSHRVQKSCMPGCLTEYKLPVADSGPFGVTAGPDGKVWFSHGSTIGSISNSGKAVRVYSLPSTAPAVGWLTLDKKRHGIWFTERATSKIGFIKPNGSVQEYDIPAHTSPASCPLNTDDSSQITSIPQGVVPTRRYVWFTEACTDKIGRLAPNGSVTEYSTSAGSGPQGLAMGPDGNLWFTERDSNGIGKITPAGKVTEYPLASGVSPQRIVGDAKDGDVWFTELLGDAIGRITPSGHITTFPLPSGAEPVGITTGRDGSLWFVDFGHNAIGHMSVAGHLLKEYPLLSPNSYALQIAWGPDHALWVGEYGINRLARLVP